MKHVIHIYGASGSGTSTLGRYIAAQTGFCWLDSDNFLWEPTDPPFTAKRPAKKRVELLRAQIESHENTVISGSLTGWGDPVMPLFTLAIRLFVPSSVRRERLLQRERERYGDRIDDGGDMRTIHLQFMEWAMQYDTGDVNIRSAAMHDTWEKRLTCPILMLDGTQPPEKNFEIIRQYL